MMQEKEVMQLLEETQAVLHGHFLLTSGLHSPMYVEKFNVLQHPKYTEMLCQELAERYAADNVELVIGPMTGGILLAHEVGKALGTRAIFTERENGKMTLKRGFQIPEGTRVLIVEDIVTTGGSVKEVLDVVKHTAAYLLVSAFWLTAAAAKLILACAPKHCCIWTFPLMTRTTARSAKKANRLQNADVPVSKKFKI